MEKKFFEPLSKNAKCTRCKKQAIIRLPSHNAKFCRECFIHFFKTAVIRAMKKIGISKDTPIMVAVSGGKDSLVLWEILNRLGYKTKGVHIDLGIEQFSEKSIDVIKDFAEQRNLKWVKYDLRDFVGHSMVEIHKKIRRKICSFCGKLKRQLLDMATITEGFNVVATGHNLDDEAARLLGNLMGKRLHYVKKMYPYLPSPHPKIPAKIKPLYRLEIKEILIYAKLNSIEPVDIDCPLSKGATSRKFKMALDLLENKMPGIKRNFLFSYIDDNKPLNTFENYNQCKICGYPTYLDLCNLCNIKKLVQS